MTSAGISHSELVFIKEGIEQNVRNDGRGRMDYRHFHIQTGVIPTANGSARVKLDTTEVLVSVKAEVEVPDADAFDKGKVVCAVECAPSASLDFEGKGGQALSTQLTAELQRLVAESKSINLDSLCIVPGKQCWVIYIDAVVQDSAGNLTDAISLGTKAALATATLPPVEVIDTENGTTEVNVSDDPHDARPIATDDVPVCVSLTKIGQYFVVDPSQEEELCMSAKVTVAVNKKGQVCGVYKSGPGGISPAALTDMVKAAVTIGKQMIATVQNTVNKAATSDAAGTFVRGVRLDEDEDEEGDEGLDVF